MTRQRTGVAYIYRAEKEKGGGLLGEIVLTRCSILALLLILFPARRTNKLTHYADDSKNNGWFRELRGKKEEEKRKRKTISQ